MSQIKGPQKAYEHSAPIKSQEAKIQIASVSPKELIDASREEVIARLGLASLIRQERQSLTLQFKKDNCVLDVVLYGNKQEKRVKFIDLRDTEGNAASTEQCYVKFQELIMKENFNLSPNCNIDTSVPNKISIRLQPQVTLFKTETKVVLFLLVLFNWIIGVSFFLLGAWPVLIFLAVDILLIYYF